jgi:hypothetical protein
VITVAFRGKQGQAQERRAATSDPTIRLAGNWEGYYHWKRPQDTIYTAAMSLSRVNGELTGRLIVHTSAADYWEQAVTASIGSDGSFHLLIAPTSYESIESQDTIRVSQKIVDGQVSVDNRSLDGQIQGDQGGLVHFGRVDTITDFQQALVAYPQNITTAWNNTMAKMVGNWRYSGEQWNGLTRWYEGEGINGRDLGQPAKTVVSDTLTLQLQGNQIVGTRIIEQSWLPINSSTSCIYFEGPNGACRDTERWTTRYSVVAATGGNGYAHATSTYLDCQGDCNGVSISNDPTPFYFKLENSLDILNPCQSCVWPFKDERFVKVQ